MSFDPEMFGQAMADLIKNAVDPLRQEIADLKKQLSERVELSRDELMAELREDIAKAVAAIPLPENGKDGEPGPKGDPGEKGADGVGISGAMIDRDGSLLITLANGEVKNLGRVVGKDGKDGQDGLSFESFDLGYDPGEHEVCIKASVAGRTKEVRYPAGGLRPAGYWRE